jgi:hypothetical protein
MKKGLKIRQFWLLKNCKQAWIIKRKQKVSFLREDVYELRIELPSAWKPASVLKSNPPLNRTKSMDPTFFPFRYGT